jgi:putative nucleotidyltransferase with HDIG domain
MTFNRDSVPRHAAVVGLALLVVTAMHWLTPVQPGAEHLVHILFRKLFVVPVVLSAVWFGLRGAIITAVITTATYLPYVFMRWNDQAAENMNQAGEMISVWGVALIAGWLVGREKAALLAKAEVHRGALTALVSALDAREHDTELHSWRVRAYAMCIAERMKLSQADRRVIEQAALLHDVGKIGVPDHILLKPGPLTEAEWKIMRQHPEIGHRILASVPSLKEISTVVLTHHEHYDGSGYPRGITGDQIPLGARVFAVADAYDALTSSRPYRKATSIEDARGIINRDRGKYFDPRVVDTFLKVTPAELKALRSVAAHTGEPLG